MAVLMSLVKTLRDCARSRAVLQLEVLALRHQLRVLQRSHPHRLQLTRVDRLLWVWLSRAWNQWRTALVIVKPETVIAWHRRGFRLFWAWKSRHRMGRPTVSQEIRTLIHTMSAANPLWGAPRIHGELLKLGFTISQTTVAKYMVRRQGPPSQTWRTFLANHAQQLVAADFFVVPTATCRLLFVLVLLAHDRRRVVHMAVTEHPTAAWTVQQFRDAFPWDELPRYVLRDRDHAFDHLKTIGTQEVLTAPGSPLAERLRRTFHWIGSARVPRSRDRGDGGRPSSRPQRVRCLQRTNTHASEPEQGCTPSPSCHAADGWPRDGHSAGRRLAPPLRATRRVVSPTSPSLFVNGRRLTRVYAALATASVRRSSSRHDSAEPMRKPRRSGRTHFSQAGSS
jgi:putative transposase